jgi:uncharacterized membrane protein
MLDTVEGLPAHPLLVHAVVVLVPLTALLAVLIVLWPAARRRMAGAWLFVATGTMMATVLAAMAGRWLQQHGSMMMNSALIRRHGDLGGQLVLWFSLLTISMICWWALYTPLFADEVARFSMPARRAVGVVAGVSTLAFAVISTWLVVFVGQLGSQAVWGMLVC